MFSREKAVVEKCVDVFQQIILKPLIEDTCNSDAGVEILSQPFKQGQLAWSLLDSISCSETYMYYFKLGASKLAGEILWPYCGQLLERLKCGEMHEVACWTILSQAMLHKPKKAS